MSEAEAEVAHEIVHIHFDAKYRIEVLEQLLPSAESSESLDGENEIVEPSAPGMLTSKAADILKMHAYRDAIRRSFGAYVLFPGDTNRRWAMYTEMLPGLGAFALRPGRENPAFLEFLNQLIAEMANPTTKRAQWSRDAATLYADGDSVGGEPS
jgi:predicted component of viral defense system (DUF524 family)